MKRYIPLVLAILLFVIVHEGTHAVVASMFNEFASFQVKYYGFEVHFKTPVPDRSGIKWGFISGMSNIITLTIGYLLFIYRKNVANYKSAFFRTFGYWVTFFFLLFDPLNLSIMPFVFGGDIGGIVEGFRINKYLVQFIFFMVLLINRELIIHQLFPLYGVKSRHPLFRPLLRDRLEN